MPLQAPDMETMCHLRELVMLFIIRHFHIYLHVISTKPTLINTTSVPQLSEGEIHLCVTQTI